MRNGCRLLIILVVVTFISCDQSVRFEQPQPLNIPDMTGMPEKYQGVFISLTDSSTLEISQNQVVIYKMVSGRISRHPDEPSIRISGDTVIDIGSGFRAIGLPAGDSLDLVWPAWTDTLLAAEPGYHIRRYKGHFFLNAPMEGYWKVRMLEPRSVNELAVEELNAPENIEILKDITPVKEIRKDSIEKPRYLVNPGRRELKVLMRRGFTTSAVFRRFR